MASDSKHYHFQEFLTKLSDYYTGNYYKWLRLLLHDHIPIGHQQNGDISGLDLFNELERKGLISYTDVQILSDIAELTDQNLAKACIIEYKVVNKCNDEGTRLTPYRRALYKALREVSIVDLGRVVGFYRLNILVFKNIWDVVFHLEIQNELEDTQEKWERFAKLVNETAKKQLKAYQPPPTDGTESGGPTACRAGGLPTPTANQPKETKGGGESKSGTASLLPPKEISQETYQLIKTMVADSYNAQKCLYKLKVLFGDHVSRNDLTKITDTMSFLSALDKSDHLNREDITIIYNTIKVTGNFALQRKIKEKLPLFPDVKKIAISKFKIHRQKLMQFGMELTETDVNRIDGFCNEPLKVYTNSWEMIYDLQLQHIIKDDMDVMNKFIETLKTLGIWAVEKLEKLIED